MTVTHVLPWCNRT